MQMEESDLEESKSSSSLFSRFRSPSFQQNEVKALLQLIEKHRYVILNKSTNSAANNAKERVWAKVAAEFTRQGIGPKRSVDVLKTKWENLKRNARKLAKDVIDNDTDFSKDEIKRTITMICSAENIEFDVQNNPGNSFDEPDFKLWLSDEEDNPSFTLGSEVPKETITPTKFDVPTGYSPRDCRLLLQCVRQEKKALFTNTSHFKRQEAWKRVADAYNSQSPRKKTAKELNKKFNTMKSVARKVNFKEFFKNTKRRKYGQLEDDNTPLIEKIKPEPVIDCAAGFDIDTDDEQVLNNPVDNFSTKHHRLSFHQDPLNNAHGSDSGLGLSTETKDAARLKVELLNYKMETARLERKRIEEAMKSEEKEREIRSIEQALRLRAARLAAAVAEAQLSASHPALRYTHDERRAQQYLTNAQLDIG